MSNPNEFLAGGTRRDEFGRRILGYRTLNSAPRTGDTPEGGTVVDSEGRELVVGFELAVAETSTAPLWGPVDAGYIAWTHDPVIMRTAEPLEERQIQFCGLHLPAGTITNVTVSAEVVSAKEEFKKYQETKFGLYNSSGTLLRQTGIVNWAAFSTANKEEYALRAVEPGHVGWSINKTTALTSPIVVTAGTYYVGIFSGKVEAGEKRLEIAQAEWHLQSVAQFRETREVQTGLPASVNLNALFYSYHWPWVAVS